jgi:hypothetical protein
MPFKHVCTDLPPDAWFLGDPARVSLANLALGVHPSCRWFVQTTRSNWNRLINEIRLTDGVRANATWVDLEPGGDLSRRD